MLKKSFIIFFIWCFTESLGAPCGSSNYAWTSSWTGAANGIFTLQFPSSVNSWTLVVTFSTPVTLLQVYDARGISCSGNTCTFSNSSYNYQQSANALLSLPFQASFTTSSPPSVTAMVLNGLTLCSSGTNVPTTTTSVTTSAKTTTVTSTTKPGSTTTKSPTTTTGSTSTSTKPTTTLPSTTTTKPTTTLTTTKPTTTPPTTTKPTTTPSTTTKTTTVTTRPTTTTPPSTTTKSPTTTAQPPSTTTASPNGQKGVYVPFPSKVLGMYLLLSDNTQTNFNDFSNWSPKLFPYQQQAANVLYFSFIDPTTMNVPVAFANFARTRGTNAAGSIPSNTMVLFAIGGIGYSQNPGYTQWPWLQSVSAAEAMAVRVASWPQQYGIDGIDLDIESTAGNQAGAGPNMVAFIKKLRSLVPNIFIGQPTYGYPQVDAENYVINQSWDANGNYKSVADEIGLMVYDSPPFNWANSYTQGADKPAGWPITIRAPTNVILGGVSGTALPADIQAATSACISGGYRGLMVWYASVQNGFNYGYTDDASQSPNSQQALITALNSLRASG